MFTCADFCVLDKMKKTRQELEVNISTQFAISLVFYIYLKASYYIKLLRWPKLCIFNHILYHFLKELGQGMAANYYKKKKH